MKARVRSARVAALLAVLLKLAGAQSVNVMVCNSASPQTTIQASDASALVGDLLLTCTGGFTYTTTAAPILTVDFRVTMPQPITSRVISTSGGNVSEALLLIDDAGSVAPGAILVAGFGSLAPPTLCAYNASSGGCPAYPNVSPTGGIPVMTGAPNPLGSPSPTPPAANIYQGVVSGNSVTFFGVPILPPGSLSVRTYRITNLRVNAAANSSPVISSLSVQGRGASLMTLNQTQTAMATTIPSANLILSAGYSLPVPARVAPGTVITLFVHGAGGKLAGRVSAVSFPLPTDLAGISVTLIQTAGPPSVPVPILAVQPVRTCSGSDPACGQYTAITIQIPFELSGISPSTRLVVVENGVPGSEFGLKPVADQVHVPNSCEAQANTMFGCSPAPLVTHASGAPVDLFNPAKSGEELVIYAFGLGATTPTVPTGQATPVPAPVKQPLQLNFDYRPNAAPSRSLTVPPECATLPTCPQVQPAFAGLTPGFAGLYQVNFIVPPPPAGTPRCNAPTFDPANPPSIASNLTVSIIAPNSFDGGGICVDTSGS